MGMFLQKHHLLEQLHIDGGSLDGAGNPTDGYIIRGGREMDMTYENLWDMFQDIPAFRNAGSLQCTGRIQIN